MKVYLDDTKLEQEFNNLDREDLVAKIEEQIEGKIIEKVYLGKQEFSLAEFKESGIKIQGISSKIQFITKDIEELTKETLETAQDYLPKLRQGLNDTVNLFKQGKLNQAHQKYGLCLEGLEWYTQAIFNIISVSNQQEEVEEIENLLNDFTKSINRSAIAYQHGDLNNVVGIIQEETIDFVEQFIEVNNSLSKQEN
ncbi:hypothetical protein MWH28_01420 [Natroniella sulfidigena]|uniref:hypothetical protein n=1 Tax=Natroniella sulfidigena TaxID=723921 RepID=UPI00200B7E44|nr:hypothetical protein [Natroniella sulfidigena]MCK8816023.1 hypothetical protein [Natroniella sulfidigena]